jgi:hypothetical protein
MKLWAAKSVVTLELAAASVTAIGCGPGYVGVYARTGPAPGASSVWINGYWGYRNNSYAWVRGRWDRPPRGHRRWEDGRWEHRGDGYRWREGRWR